MMKRKKITTSRKPRIRRERDPIPWKYCALTLVCGLLLVSGFFMAARLHFSSMDFGIQNAKLRRQVEKLKSEKRRMILEREMAISVISKSAIKLGFRESTASNIEVVTYREPVETTTHTISSDEQVTSAFARAENLFGQKPTKASLPEKGARKTIINEPKVKFQNEKTGKKGRRLDIDDETAALITR